MSKEINEKAEMRTILHFRADFISKAPETYHAELEAQFAKLSSTSGFRDVKTSLLEDPKVSPGAYNIATATGLDANREIYRDGQRTRGISDAQGTFPSYVPGKGLFMNQNDIHIPIILGPKAALRIEGLSKEEAVDRMELERLKTSETNLQSSRQALARDAWSGTMIQAGKASDKVRAAIKER